MVALTLRGVCMSTVDMPEACPYNWSPVLDTSYRTRPTILAGAGSAVSLRASAASEESRSRILNPASCIPNLAS